jgi:hypothetical protein
MQLSHQLDSVSKSHFLAEEIDAIAHYAETYLPILGRSASRSKGQIVAENAGRL